MCWRGVRKERGDEPIIRCGGAVVSADKRPFTAMQPRDGDIVAECGHKNPVHFYRLPELVQLECDHPDCSGLASWYACCRRCHVQIMSGRANGFSIRKHGTWKGNEPELRVPAERDS